MTVKKTPIESTCALFWNVLSMPAPAPRWSAGSEFMTLAMFGAKNSPRDRPIEQQQQPEPDVVEVHRHAG